MTKLKHYLRDHLLPAMAIVCTVAGVYAQEYVSGPDNIPAVISRKQAEQLSLTHPAPEYPPVAMANMIQGCVQLKLTVDDAGNVASVHVVDGDAILAASAVQATHRWMYHPLSTPAGPVGFITTVRLRFILQPGATDISPRKAEQDFLRQVKPPQRLRPLENVSPQEIVHMRLLVNDQGQVVDREALTSGGAQVAAAGDTVKGWTFRPASWGNLPIASYLNVDVPASTPLVTRAAANPGSR